MIDIKNLSIQFTGENLFENVNLKIHFNDKIALVGSNGKGKSTFLKLLCGFEQPETGDIIKQKGIRIGYLQQDFLSFNGNTIFDEVKTSLCEINTLIEHEKEILNEINKTELDQEIRDELLKELGQLQHRKEAVNFYSAESRIEKVLIGLGFKEKDFFRYTNEFSGGWQMRIQLAKILLADNDLILLDEPTNHLDIDTLEWLIDYLKNFIGAIIVVSHDRHFINNVTQKTLEIFSESINFYPGNYEKYLKYKDERETQLKELQKNREKKIKETERFIERFRYKNTKARQVQSRIKMLDKLESLDIIEEEKVVNIKFPEPTRSGTIPVELINVSKSYETTLALKNIDLKIERGEKIAVVGPNGAGKSTFVKILGSKIEPTNGEIIYGHNTITSYFEQEVVNNLNQDFDLIDTLEEINDNLTVSQLRGILGSFLFSGDDVFKKIKVLSGGEKSRIALAKLLLTKSNFIILDEPTNHLDYSSKSVLQNALVDFSGTIVIVSHDIDFLKPIVNKVYEFRDGYIRIFYGGIDYYLQKRTEMESREQSQIKKYDSNTRKLKKKIEAGNRQKKYSLTKDLKTALERCEINIKHLEDSKKKIEQELTDPKIFSDQIKAKEKNFEYSIIKTELEKEYEKWTEITDKIEAIENSIEI